MSHKNAVLIMIFCTAVFAILLFLGLANIDPKTTQWLGFVIITAAMLLFFWSFFGTIVLTHRALRRKNKSTLFCLRQASFFSVLAVLAIYLQRFELLTWLNAAVLIGIVVLLEVFFIGKEEMIH